jgi:hypothetical protein
LWVMLATTAQRLLTLLLEATLRTRRPLRVISFSSFAEEVALVRVPVPSFGFQNLNLLRIAICGF